MKNVKEDWQQVQLGALGKWCGGGTPDRSIVEYWSNGKIPWVSPKDMSTIYVTCSEESISEKAVKESSTKIVPADSILVVVRSGILKKKLPVALACVDVAINQDMKALPPSKGHDSKYIMNSLLFNSHKILKACSKTGTTVESINSAALMKFQISVPPLKEQNKIAVILSAWDRAIEQTRKLIEAMTKLKKALMQQLLTGEIRFPEFGDIDFTEMELRDFLTPTERPVQRPDSAYRALGIRSHGKGTFERSIDDPDSVMMDTLFEVKKDDLIVNITFGWEGAIAIVNKSDEGALVSHRFPTFVFKKDVAIPEYFRHVIVAKIFIHELGLISPGGAGRNRVLSKKAFLKIKVQMPTVSEQKRIANVLNALDKEVMLLDSYVVMLQRQKTGLMQKLLTGKIRVKV